MRIGGGLKAINAPDGICDLAPLKGAIAINAAKSWMITAARRFWIRIRHKLRSPEYFAPRFFVSKLPLIRFSGSFHP